MSDTIDAMGSSLVKSMGVAYAVSCDKAAGIDVDHIQKSYLLFAFQKCLLLRRMCPMHTPLCLVFVF